MNKELTIGEFAKLMDVSTHQIRYFEEKGILFPRYINKNGYRMYGIEQIYRLSHILLLRRLNISVSDIKEQLTTFSTEDYINVLEKSVEDIEKQIQDLYTLKGITNSIIQKAKTHQKNINEFTFKSLPTRKLFLVEKTDLTASYNARDLYEVLYKSIKIDDFYVRDFINLIDEKNLHICIESNNSKDYILKKGQYLSYQFLIKEESELDTRIDNFFTYARENNIKLSGYLIVIEESDIAMFYNEELPIEIQMMIK